MEPKHLFLRTNLIKKALSLFLLINTPITTVSASTDDELTEAISENNDLVYLQADNQTDTETESQITQDLNQQASDQEPTEDELPLTDNTTVTESDTVVPAEDDAVSTQTAEEEAAAQAEAEAQAAEEAAAQAEAEVQAAEQARIKAEAQAKEKAKEKAKKKKKKKTKKTKKTKKDTTQPTTAKAQERPKSKTITQTTEPIKPEIRIIEPDGVYFYTNNATKMVPGAKPYEVYWRKDGTDTWISAGGALKEIQLKEIIYGISLNKKQYRYDAKNRKWLQEPTTIKELPDPKKVYEVRIKEDKDLIVYTNDATKDVPTAKKHAVYRRKDGTKVWESTSGWLTIVKSRNVICGPGFDGKRYMLKDRNHKIWSHD